MEENLFLEQPIAVWEGEGGGSGQAAPNADRRSARPASAGQWTGTPNQIEWAVQIKERVSAEFDRVEKALQSASVKQTDQNRVDTQAIIAILEEKRTEVMARTQAGYFIHDWQELSDQVRQMIVRDPRYRAIKKSKTARERQKER